MNSYRNTTYSYPGKRTALYAKKGMVATSQPLAAQAGLDTLKAGGNAVDAAIATAAALTVVEPTSNGIGGDAFALVYLDGKVHGLNGSGRSPKAMTHESLSSRGVDAIPPYGVLPITVPGAPSAWVALSERFGKLPLLKALEPAIHYAEEGYPVSPVVAQFWHMAFNAYKVRFKGDEFAAWFDTFAPGGQAPEVGDVVKFPGHASTLKAIGETNGEAFYRGEVADKIDRTMRIHNGLLSRDDLAAHTAEWVDPLCVRYRGHDVYELPPNTQGIIALEGLGILEQLHDRGTVGMHEQIEALKRASVDAFNHVADTTSMNKAPSSFLTPSCLEKLADQIGTHATDITDFTPPRGGTVYLSTADADGNMVSFIQSNYMGFGSGVVVPGTGIALQNRAHNFNAKPGHPNAYGPSKRTFHTIIPGMYVKPGEAVCAFGVMGGFMQPQGHMQVLSRLIDDGDNPQSALDGPRWFWESGKRLYIEKAMPEHLIKDLKKRGHDVVIDDGVARYGRGQIIIQNLKARAYVGGTEKRADGHIAVW